MAGPASVILAGSVTVWLAVNGSDGLVADDYYKQGLSINQQLGRTKYAEDHDIRATVYKSGDKFRIIVKDASGASQNSTLALRIVHPTVSGMDKTVELLNEGGGIYTASSLVDSEAGSRRYVILEDSSGKWRLNGVWDLRDDGSIELPNSNK